MKRIQTLSDEAVRGLVETIRVAVLWREEVDYKCGEVDDLKCRLCPFDATRECCDTMHTAGGWIRWALEDVEDSTKGDVNKEGNTPVRRLQVLSDKAIEAFLETIREATLSNTPEVQFMCLEPVMLSCGNCPLFCGECTQLMTVEQWTNWALEKVTDPEGRW